MLVHDAGRNIALKYTNTGPMKYTNTGPMKVMRLTTHLKFDHLRLDNNLSHKQYHNNNQIDIM